jgi:hypothetical protein
MARRPVPVVPCVLLHEVLPDPPRRHDLFAEGEGVVQARAFAQSVARCQSSQSRSISRSGSLRQSFVLDGGLTAGRSFGLSGPGLARFP